jgi:hypothetical protein
LDAAAIQSNMNSCLTGNETNIVGHFVFEDGSGTTLTDQSATAINGTLTNMDGSADWVQITSPSCGEKLCDYQMSTEITIGDNTPPTAVAQDISVQIDINTGLANIVAADIDNGSSDNCTGGITLSLSTTEFTCADMGVNLVTLTVEDASGNISTADATVTVTSSINDEVVSATNQILCGAGSSTSITTGSSVVGVNYYLKNSANNTEVDGPIAGTGNGLNFNTGAINSLTTFKVTGYIPSSASCEFEMSQTATISIHPTYNLSETVSVCNGVSYTFPDGTTQNNITAQVIHVSNLVTNITACDSVITTTVNISSSYNLTETVAVCNGGSYTFPDGTTQNNITSQVIYTSNMQTVGTGCDSIIETTVNINPTYNLTETAYVCNDASYVFPDGTTQNNITAQVVYTSNLQTVVIGCDSTIETTLNVVPLYNLSETVVVCSGDSYTFPDGTTQNNITSQVIYTSNLQTVSIGCDSIIETTVNINPTYMQSESISLCSGESYTFPDGTTQANITSQVIYTSNLQTIAAGCDSISEESREGKDRINRWAAYN